MWWGGHASDGRIGPRMKNHKESSLKMAVPPLALLALIVAAAAAHQGKPGSLAISAQDGPWPVSEPTALMQEWLP